METHVTPRLASLTGSRLEDETPLGKALILAAWLFAIAALLFLGLIIMVPQAQTKN